MNSYELEVREVPTEAVSVEQCSNGLLFCCVVDDKKMSIWMVRLASQASDCPFEVIENDSVTSPDT